MEATVPYPGTLAPSPKRTTTRPLREELYALLESGYFGHARVELLGGEPMTAFPEPAAHDDTVQLVYDALLAGGAGISVFRQNLIELPSGDALHPDVFVMPGEIDPEGDPTSLDPLLVVEVAWSSLRRDRGIKSELYAAAGVGEYWIVNPRAGQIEVRRDPSGSEYVTHELHEGGSVIRPLFAPVLALSVADLLA